MFMVTEYAALNHCIKDSLKLESKQNSDGQKDGQTLVH